MSSRDRVIVGMLAGITAMLGSIVGVLSGGAASPPVAPFTPVQVAPEQKTHGTKVEYVPVVVIVKPDGSIVVHFPDTLPGRK